MTDSPKSRPIDWLLVLALSTFPLLQSLFSVAGWADALGRPTTPLLLALGITIVWVVVVTATRTPRPLLTLLYAGIVAAVASTVLSLLIPAARNGDATNLLDSANIAATLIVTLVLYSLWGLVAGLIAEGIRRLGVRNGDQA